MEANKKGFGKQHNKMKDRMIRIQSSLQKGPKRKDECVREGGNRKVVDEGGGTMRALRNCLQTG